MKSFFLILLVVSVPSLLMAQDGAIKKGGMEVNAGLGIWSNAPVIMPVHVGMDFGIAKDISVGFDLGWRLYNQDDWKHSVLVLQGRFDYHFNALLRLKNNWDVYAGLQLGPAFITASDDYTGTKEGFNFVLDGVFGFRWFFSGKMGLNSELGITGVFPDIANPPALFLNLGLTFRVK